MNSIYNISLDLHKTSAPISLSVKQGDTGREIHISLTDGSTPYKIPDGSYAVFAGTKPDNKVLWNACTIKDNTIIYEMTEQTVVVAGWVPVQIRLYSAGGKLLTSPDFVLIVDEPAVADGTVVAVSDNEITALTQLVTECTALKADLEEFKTGGYYTPAVTQPDENTLQIDFSPSNEDMPAVESVKVTLPGGSGSDSTQNVTNADVASIKTVLGNIMTILKAQVEDEEGTPQGYNTDVSGLVSQNDTLIAALGTTDDSEEEHTHSYTSSVTTAATCTTAGVRTYTCSCGKSYTESIPATGHNYVDGVCTVCGAADPSYSEDVTLSSISATYTGGDATVGTALDDLTGIVVIAHYSDGSTETVTGYTLSGIIVEGSNTITVSYGGMATSFTVTGVVSIEEIVLPDGYTKLDYLVSSSASYTVLDDGFDENTVFEVEVTPTELTEWFGAVWDAGNYSAFQVQSTGLRFARANTKLPAQRKSAVAVGQKVNVKAYINDAVYVNGVINAAANGVVYSIAYGDTPSTFNIHLNAELTTSGSVHGGRGFTGHWHYCKFWQSDVLIYNLVPCKNPDGIVGFYNLISGKFYGSVTETAFAEPA